MFSFHNSLAAQKGLDFLFLCFYFLYRYLISFIMFSKDVGEVLVIYHHTGNLINI